MATPKSDEMQKLVKKGKAMPAPGQDRPGRFPIRNGDDLGKAISAVGRVKPPTEAARAKVRRYIISRAKALGLSSKIPNNWASDGTLQSSS